jgi:hypothetical protein
MPGASRITGRLWVGAFPPPGDYAKSFDTIVFTAMEHQPSAESYPGVRVRHHPFDDSVSPTKKDLEAAAMASAAVARDLQRGRRVLVTCAMGRNRSALVAALALQRCTGAAGADVLSLVRARRTDAVGVRALSNPAFQKLLRSLPGACKSPRLSVRA